MKTRCRGSITRWPLAVFLSSTLHRLVRHLSFAHPRKSCAFHPTLARQHLEVHSWTSYVLPCYSDAKQRTTPLTRPKTEVRSRAAPVSTRLSAAQLRLATSPPHLSSRRVFTVIIIFEVHGEMVPGCPRKSCPSDFSIALPPRCFDFPDDPSAIGAISARKALSFDLLLFTLEEVAKWPHLAAWATAFLTSVKFLSFSASMSLIRFDLLRLFFACALLLLRLD